MGHKENTGTKHNSESSADMSRAKPDACGMVRGDGNRILHTSCSPTQRMGNRESSNGFPEPTAQGYQEFLSKKRMVSSSVGFNVRTEDLNQNLFEFQKDLVAWALRRGRAAVFAD